MGNVKLFSADLNAMTPTASVGSDPLYPLSNLLDYNPSKLWKPATATDGAYLSFAVPAWFGMAQKNMLALHRHNLIDVVDNGGRVLFQRSTTADFAVATTLFDSNASGYPPDPWIFSFADTSNQYFRLLFQTLNGTIPYVGLAMIGRDTDLGTPYSLPYKSVGKRFKTIETEALDGTLRKSQLTDGRRRLSFGFKGGNALSELSKTGLQFFFGTVVRGDLRPLFLTDTDTAVYYVYFENTEDPIEVIGYHLNQVATLNFKFFEIG
jgi:hypothetical protein